MSRIRLAQSLLATIAAAWPAVVVAQLPAAARNGAASLPAVVKSIGKPPLPITLAQFEQASQIATLAAERGMHELSLRAIRRALMNGPPIDLEGIPALGKRKPRARIRASAPVPSGPTANVESQVAQTLDALAQAWQTAPAEETYQTLAAVVLPEGRPREIFLYDDFSGSSSPRSHGFRRSSGTRGQRRSPTATVGGVRRLRSTVLPPLGGVQWPIVSRLLVDAAARAARLDDLKQRVLARDGEHADLAATILLVQAALLDPHCDATTCWPYLKRLAEHNPPEYARQLLRELMIGIRGPEMPAEMIAWLEAKLEHETRASRGLADDRMWLKVFLALARGRFAQGDVTQARRHLRRYAEFGLGGDMEENERELYLTTRWLNVAREFIAEGLIDEALDALAAYVDGDEQVANEPLIVPVWLGLRRQLIEKLSAADRYQRLASWTMPEGERPRLRFIGCFVPRDGRPGVFQTDLYRSWPDDVIASNFQLLIAAARDAGQLDDLMRRSAAYSAAGDVQAVLLHVLVAVATGSDEQAGPALDRLVSLQQPAPSSPEQPRQLISEAAYLLIRTALRSASLRPHGGTLARLGESWPWRWTNDAFRGLIEIDRAARRREANLNASDPARAAFAHWQIARTGGHWTSLMDVPAFWADSGDDLRCIGGAGSSALVFDCPLVGIGEISVDAVSSLETISYGGITIGASGPSVHDRTFPKTVMDALQTTRGFSLRSPASRLTLHFEPEANLVLCNGDLAYDIPQPSAAAPWLALCSWGPRGAVFHRLTISGHWWVPREVSLVEGNRLIGWSRGFYEDRPAPQRVRLKPTIAISAPVASSPRAVPSAPAVPSSPGGAVSGRVGAPSGFAGRMRTTTATRLAAATFPGGRSRSAGGFWWARDGVINGGSLARTTQEALAPSRLTYFRPLRNGDELRYEFLCQAGMAVGPSHFPPPMMVHPALDRLTFLLEADGVRLHWMTNHPDVEAGGLPLDNVADEPAARRGPARLPLVDRDWNRVAIKLIDDEVLIELNGVLVFQRRLESTNDRLFSFFHYQDQTQALVRNVVLSGNWPEKLPPNEELFARLRPLNEAERAVQAKLVGAEQFESDQTEAKEKTR